MVATRRGSDTRRAAWTSRPPIPRGFQRERDETSRGRKYWNAADIRVPTLILRGELDVWSRPEDLVALERELVNAPRVRAVTIPDRTHYLFNDRHERGRTSMIAEGTAFLASSR